MMDLSAPPSSTIKILPHTCREWRQGNVTKLRDDGFLLLEEVPNDPQAVWVVADVLWSSAAPHHHRGRLARIDIGKCQSDTLPAPLFAASIHHVDTHGHSPLGEANVARLTDCFFRRRRRDSIASIRVGPDHQPGASVSISGRPGFRRQRGGTLQRTGVAAGSEPILRSRDVLRSAGVLGDRRSGYGKGLKG